jgi:integrase
LFNFAIDRDILKTTPCYRVKPPAKSQPKDRYLTLDEVGQFWNSLESAPLDESTKNVLRLLQLTLQRCSEVVGMNKNELNLKAGTWVIPASRVKNKRSHLVTLSPPVIEIIKT